MQSEHKAESTWRLGACFGSILLPESMATDGNNKRVKVKIHVIFEGTALDIHVGRPPNLSFSLGVDVAGALGVALSAGDGLGMWILGR